MTTSQTFTGARTSLDVARRWVLTVPSLASSVTSGNESLKSVPLLNGNGLRRFGLLDRLGEVEACSTRHSARNQRKLLAVIINSHRGM